MYVKFFVQIGYSKIHKKTIKKDYWCKRKEPMQSGYNRLTISKWKKDTENLGMLSLINQFNSSGFPLKSWCTQTTIFPKVLRMKDKTVNQKKISWHRNLLNKLISQCVVLLTVFSLITNIELSLNKIFKQLNNMRHVTVYTTDKEYSHFV